MRKVFFLLLISCVALSTRVSLLVVPQNPSLERGILTLLESVDDFRVLESDALREKMRSDEILSVVFAGKILGLDYIFLVEMEESEGHVRGSLKLVDVKPAQVSTLWRFDLSGKDSLERLIDGVVEVIRKNFEGGFEGMRLRVEGWKEGRFYRPGDVVRFDGRLFRCERIHLSLEENAPGRSDFWSEVEEKIVLGYFPSWAIHTKGFGVEDIRADLLTHIAFAFANISEGGECVVGDPETDLKHFSLLKRLKEKYPHLKILISVGGWNWSKNFSKVASSRESREKFVRSCIETFLKGNFSGGEHPGVFDGIDLDWEFPVSGGKYPGRREDRENFTELLREFRRQLDKLSKETGRHYELSIAGGVSKDYIFENTEMGKISKMVDFITVMAYDFSGPWSGRTGFHSNLYGPPDELSADGAIGDYMKAGVPPEKLVLGIPLYGRSWGNVPSKNDGLFQVSNELGPGSVESGVLDYKHIVNVYEKRLRKHFHPLYQAPWLYGGGVFITYDDVTSVSLKALYVLEKGLRGVAVWELSSDSTARERSLLEFLSDILMAR